jgi:cell division protein ZapA
LKRKVEVSLLGRSFTVKSEKDEAYLHQVASFVNRKFDDLRHQTRTSTSHDLVLLVALNLADELFQSEERGRDSRADLRRRSERLLQSLDAALSDKPEESVPALVAPGAMAR